MRNRKCPFCPAVFNEKQNFCKHVVIKHNDQIPEEVEIPLEYAYSLMVNKPMGRLCTECHKNNVPFNTSTLKYARFCSDQCKDKYVETVKNRMKNKYGKEHLLDDPEYQEKMINNHPNAKDYIWDDKHKFRIIGTYEEDFLNKLKSLNWNPDDILAPSPHIIYYKWKDGTEHFYIPDFELPSISLIVEIKQGNFNTSYMEHNREIEALKDRAARNFCEENNMHYIKIIDKDYTEFMRDYVKSDQNQPE